MGSSIILRRAASSASTLALRSAGSRAQNIKSLSVHDHGRLSQELCARKGIPLLSRYLSSDSKKTSVEDTKKRSVEDTKREDIEETEKTSVEDTKKLSPEEKGILEIVEAKLIKGALESSYNVNKIDGFPFIVEDEHKEESVLNLRRVYENEVIHVKILNYALESGKDIIPVTVEVCKKGTLSLMFFGSALPKAIQIANFFIATKVSQGLVHYEEPNFSNIDEKLQKAFLKYLDIRGINTTMFNCLRKHINQKKGSLVWLEDLKKFMEI